MPFARSIHSPCGGNHLLFPDGASMLEPHESKDRDLKGLKGLKGEN